MQQQKCLCVYQSRTEPKIWKSKRNLPVVLPCEVMLLKKYFLDVRDLNLKT